MEPISRSSRDLNNLAAAGRSYITIGDKIKSDAEKALNIKKQPGLKAAAMLTGDNSRPAKAAAEMLQTDNVYADLLPEDKVDIFGQLINNGSGRGEYVNRVFLRIESDCSGTPGDFVYLVFDRFGCRPGFLF